ncbi:hypothetical protein EZV62_019229 [Acer yangbiense]|uniref:DUF4283 domain-containing protein n=1 Tax=Acer yangbiense TaxID=1000413 RepID=A0A5C7H9U6_9ROSI|nr:hypothetical protein EZV62_019229 [Acer yangbiense]
MNIDEVTKLCVELSLNEEEGPLMSLHGDLKDDGVKHMALRTEREGDIKNMSFNKAAFWIRILNVPLLCMTKDIGLFLGSLIGEVREIAVGPLGECVRKFIRVRVVIDIDKPLHRILRVDVM